MYKTGDHRSFIILGVTMAGAKFRPSDWADRLSSTLSAFGATRKVRYSPYVKPGDYEGHKAVFVEGRLSALAPKAYEFLREFARKNDLQVVDKETSPAIDH